MKKIASIILVLFVGLIFGNVNCQMHPPFLHKIRLTAKKHKKKFLMSAACIGGVAIFVGLRRYVCNRQPILHGQGVTNSVIFNELMKDKWKRVDLSFDESNRKHQKLKEHALVLYKDSDDNSRDIRICVGSLTEGGSRLILDELKELMPSLERYIQRDNSWTNECPRRVIVEYYYGFRSYDTFTNPELSPRYQKELFLKK